MALFIGFLIIVGLLIWAIKLDPVAIIFFFFFACFLIRRDNTPQTEIGWIMLVIMAAGMTVNIVKKRNRDRDININININIDNEWYLK